MASPTAAVTIPLEVQKLQESSAPPVNKQGQSKFDGVLANKTQGANGVQAVKEVQSAERIHRTDQIRALETVGKTDKSAVAKDAVESKSPAEMRVQPKEDSQVVGMMTNMFSELEKGQVHMDQLINMGMSGKDFSNGELLSLQAGMFKYTQELDLTSKVVEKATTGLKETLKTQV